MYRRKVSTEEGKQFANDHHFLFFEVSAKNDDNIKKLLYRSVAELHNFDDEDNKSQLAEKLEKIMAIDTSSSAIIDYLCTGKQIKWHFVMAEMKVILDSGALVGAITPQVDEELGKIYASKVRGY